MPQQTLTIEGSALVARGVNSHTNDKRQSRGRPRCDHCRKPGHLRETCWKIHGKPIDWKPNRSNIDKESKANNATITEDKPATKTSTFSKEQLEIFHQMVSQNILKSSNPSQEASMVAQQCTFPTALTANMAQKQTWVVDSGASNHMTGDAKLLHDYSSQKGRASVRSANGSLSTVQVQFN